MIEIILKFANALQNIISGLRCQSSSIIVANRRLRRRSRYMLVPQYLRALDYCFALRGDVEPLMHAFIDKQETGWLTQSHVLLCFYSGKRRCSGARRSCAFSLWLSPTSTLSCRR
jgi:hypothetical protein